ncbi:MAG: M1 family aminopeptidase/hydrolase, partial [Myxococcales bacterium]
MARLDPHSYNDDAQPVVERLDWKARVDFGSRTLDAEALLSFAEAGSGPLDLDTRELDVRAVLAPDGRRLEYGLAPADPVLGSRLRIELPKGTRAVRIAYRTRPTASALQWLSPAQTAGGAHPFLFSQCQAIHARSVVPLQDTPRLRLRYRAELTVPVALRGLMAAAFVDRAESGAHAVETYEMPQPIPPYLFALAVGRLASRDLGPRTRVWAEPEVLERAAWEFEAVERMLEAGERLFGPYDWDRFDLLTMPPSFPYGGMENPRLTFLTPTLLAGDRSLVGVVAHELAHSWTGNLVSNANAEHFWLNEGWTVYAERRILEVLEGPETTALHAALGRRALDRALERFRAQPGLTKLRTSLAGVDPDEAFSEVPYEKGYLFLRALEEEVGREPFDRFVRAHFSKFRFRSLTTDD